jgi:hypothetical protein
MYSHSQRQSWCDCYRTQFDRSPHPNIVIDAGDLHNLGFDGAVIHYCMTCKHYRVLRIDRTCWPMWLIVEGPKLAAALDGYKLCDCPNAVMNPETLLKHQDRQP